MKRIRLNFKGACGFQVAEGRTLQELCEAGREHLSSCSASKDLEPNKARDSSAGRRSRKGKEKVEGKDMDQFYDGPYYAGQHLSSEEHHGNASRDRRGRLRGDGDAYYPEEPEQLDYGALDYLVD